MSAWTLPGSRSVSCLTPVRGHEHSPVHQRTHLPVFLPCYRIPTVGTFLHTSPWKLDPNKKAVVEKAVDGLKEKKSKVASSDQEEVRTAAPWCVCGSTFVIAAECGAAQAFSHYSYQGCGSALLQWLQTPDSGCQSGVQTPAQDNAGPDPHPQGEQTVPPHCR